MLKYQITEEHNIQINDEKFQGLINSDLQEIINALKASNFEVRIVGGAVRDILLGEQPRDIDLLTTATPDETIYILSSHEIEADVWGIRHGTIKAVINGIKYEITSVNFKITKDEKGNIKVNSGGSWQEDAKRRDFTINAMSMELDGKVHDYMNGIADLKEQIIRPIPDFEEKIKKDPVIILRFFKMISKMPKPRASKKTIDIIKRNITLLSSLDSKRIREELSNIRKGINPDSAFKAMQKFGVTGFLKRTLNNRKSTKE